MVNGVLIAPPLLGADPPANGDMTDGHKQPSGVRGPMVMPVFDPSKARAGLKKSTVAVSLTPSLHTQEIWVQEIKLKHTVNLSLLIWVQFIHHLYHTTICEFSFNFDLSSLIFY